MRKYRKIILGICLLSLVGTMTNTVQAASKSKISLKVGQKKKLEDFQKNSSIKVSKKGYVKVNKKGTITGYKKGNVTVTVKKNEKVKRYNVKVKNAYLSLDFNRVKAGIVVNLEKGMVRRLTGDRIAKIRNFFTKKKLPRKMISKKKLGMEKYGIHLQDDSGKEVYNITVYKRHVQIGNQKYKVSKKSDYSLLIKILKNSIQ